MNAENNIKLAIDNLRSAHTARLTEIDDLRKQINQQMNDLNNQLRDAAQRESDAAQRAATSDDAKSQAVHMQQVQMLRKEQDQLKQSANDAVKQLESIIAAKQQNASDIQGVLGTMNSSWMGI